MLIHVHDHLYDRLRSGLLDSTLCTNIPSSPSLIDHSPSRVEQSNPPHHQASALPRPQTTTSSTSDPSRTPNMADAKTTGATPQPNGTANKPTSRTHNDGSSSRAYTDQQKEAVLRVRKCSNTHFYDILGLASERTTASDAVIKKAYRKLSLLTHPDKNGYTGADEAFKMVSRAFQILSDPAKKRQFDQFGGDPDNRFASAQAAAAGGGSPFAGFGGGGRPRGGGAMFEEEISPEELFRQFFGGGGMGGGPFGASIPFSHNGERAMCANKTIRLRHSPRLRLQHGRRRPHGRHGRNGRARLPRPPVRRKQASPASRHSSRSQRPATDRFRRVSQPPPLVTTLPHPPPVVPALRRDLRAPAAGV